jgi:hypothetical protein
MAATRTFALVAVAALALSVPHVRSQNPNQKDKVDTPPLPNEAQIMQVKLQRAQAVLTALATEDYKALEENAASLVKISQATAFLRAYKTEEYEFQARVFQRSAQGIADKAAAKNLDGATLAYVDMTISCVGCHNHFRPNKKMQ